MNKMKVSARLGLKISLHLPSREGVLVEFLRRRRERIYEATNEVKNFFAHFRLDAAASE